MEVKKFAENMTLHGVGRFSISKSRVMRLIWLVFLLAFLSLLVISLMATLRRYFSKQSFTKQGTVIVAKIQFPSVTVCGPSLSKDKLKNFAMTSKNSFETEKQFEKILDKLESEANLPKVTPDEDQFFMKNISGPGLANRYLYSMGTQRIPVMKRGYCYKINPNGTFFQKEAGSDEALSAFFFLNVSDAISGAKSDTGDSIEIIVQDHQEHPFLESGSVFAPVGYLTRIEIRKTVIHRLKAPYRSKCTNGEDMQLLFQGKYTASNCQQSCFLARASKKCKALSFLYNLHLPEQLKKPFPNTKLETACSKGTLQELIDSDFSSCNCALPCFQTKFYKSASYSKWPSTVDLTSYKSIFSAALGLNRSAMTDEFVRNNFLMINIFFGDMSYQKITEVEEYTMAKLVSEVGGQMGIWLGASMFSVIEVLFLFCKLSRRLFTIRKATKRDVTIENLKVEQTV